MEVELLVNHEDGELDAQLPASLDGPEDPHLVRLSDFVDLERHGKVHPLRLARPNESLGETPEMHHFTHKREVKE